MQTFAINTDMDAPLETRHIAYVVNSHLSSGGKQTFSISEIVENTYKHPETDMAVIKVYETKLMREMTKSREQAALALLYHAENNINNILA